MRALQTLFPIRRLWWRDSSDIRRALRVWRTTGSVPVAHMVAELDWTAEYSTVKPGL